MCYTIAKQLSKELTKLMGEQINYECYNTIYGKKFLFDVTSDVTVYYTSKGGYHFDILDSGFNIRQTNISDVIRYIENYVI